VPLAEGFAQIADYIQAAERPLTSFCACELRSPAAFTEEGFRAFNLHYVKTLAEWGLYDGSTNPVARSTARRVLNSTCRLRNESTGSVMRSDL
jgi:predicted deacylase